jgi:Leucine-rich repeat (LRR) protein
MVIVQSCALTELELSDNALRQLVQVEGLQHLERLDLSHNRITDRGLMEWSYVGGLSRLRELVLLDNNIVSCWEHLSLNPDFLPNLHHLDMDFNPLPESVSKEGFPSLAELEDWPLPPEWLESDTPF